jgi:hypothetical protein
VLQLRQQEGFQNRRFFIGFSAPEALRPKLIAQAKSEVRMRSSSASSQIFSSGFFVAHL